MSSKLEGRIAQLIRLTSSDQEGEVAAALHAIMRTLKSTDAANIHALADRLENGNDLSQADMQKLYEAGYAAGVQAAERRHHGSDDFHNADGKLAWETVALFLQRNKDRLDAKHHEFVDDMASRTAWGHEPTERQHRYLHSLFYKLGGKIT
jgi:hypothetical protein